MITDAQRNARSKNIEQNGCTRDLEFIENRLLAPCVPALEAHERLVQTGYDNQAGKLMDAMEEFTAKCRDIRKAVVLIDKTTTGRAYGRSQR